MYRLLRLTARGGMIKSLAGQRDDRTRREALSDAFLPGSGGLGVGCAAPPVAANPLSRGTVFALNLEAETPAVHITGTRSLATSHSYNV